jgi:hypothetical protein
MNLVLQRRIQGIAIRQTAIEKLKEVLPVARKITTQRRAMGTTARPAPTSPEGLIASRAYFRTAQAYMLISRPTGTSTIFGVFQAIMEVS